jgi:predicted MFS family arabinose efflux permease
LAFTYLVSILQIISGFSMNAVNWIVLAYGISTAIGNIWGGRLADKLGPIHALQIIFALLVVVLFVFTFSAPYSWLALLAVVFWGAVAFGNIPALQVHVVKQAERFTLEAVDVASGLNVAAFNLGIVGGAWAGGSIVAHFGFIHTAWVGALVVLIALGITTWSGRLDKAAGIDLKAKPMSAVAAH